jgi:hypothetical protein
MVPALVRVEPETVAVIGAVTVAPEFTVMLAAVVPV